jgi:L-proline amide hydrolase
MRASQSAFSIAKALFLWHIVEMLRYSQEHRTSFGAIFYGSPHSFGGGSFLMNHPLPVDEGLVPFRGYHTWYRVVGQDTEDRLPIIVLHGGPGVPHDYLENLSDLARAGRRVIFYDQLGCGRSDHPHKPEMWTPELFVEELANLRATLNLTAVHLLGNSWGGMLAMQYLITKPQGVVSAVIESSPASVPRWMVEVNRLRSELPPEVEAILRRHEDAGTTDSQEYQDAMMVFYKRHVCRLAEWPGYLNRAFEMLAEDPEVYYTMNGPSEFHVIGTIKDWDITGQLSEIKVPCLLISGEFDEVTPATVEIVHKGIGGSEWMLMEGCSHLSHIEQPERFMQLANTFFDKTERRNGHKGFLGLFHR